MQKSPGELRCYTVTQTSVKNLPIGEKNWAKNEIMIIYVVFDYSISSHTISYEKKCPQLYNIKNSNFGISDI